MSRSWVSKSRRWQLHLQERRDIEPEHRDVAPILCLEALYFVLPTPILAGTLPHLHCCCLRPPVASTTISLGTPTLALRPCIEPPSQLSDPRLVLYPCSCRFLESLELFRVGTILSLPWVWLEPEGTLGAPRGRGSLPVAIPTLGPIVHLRCSIYCLGHLGVASFAPFSPSVPLGD